MIDRIVECPYCHKDTEFSTFKNLKFDSDKENEEQIIIRACEMCEKSFACKIIWTLEEEIITGKLEWEKNNANPAATVMVDHN